jgi:alpha-L-fucosidase
MQFDDCFVCIEGPNGRIQIYDWKRCFELVKQLQPRAVTFGDGGTDVRWVGNERGFAGETCWGTVDPDFIRNPGDSGIAQANDARADVGKIERLLEGDAPDGIGARTWRSAECDVSIRPGLFYYEEQNDKVRTVDNLLDLYFKSVGRNGVLLLNLPITPEGLVHHIDSERVAQFRAEKDQLFAVDLMSDATAVASSELTDRPAEDVLDPNPNCYWQANEVSDSNTITITLSEARVASLLCMQEAIIHGQHIGRYQVEVCNTAGDWAPLLEGTTIGHKRLHRFEAVMCTAVRLNVLDCFGPPALERICLY